MVDRNELTFVIEMCANCSGHSWNTRHDEAKYLSFFADVEAAIKSQVPNAVCLRNQVPKEWFEKEVYCQLIPNEDERVATYDILPRLGAFEVSTVVDNTDILFYSKMMSQMWPHAPSLASRIKAFVEDVTSMKGAELRSKYQTTGRQIRQARASSRLDGLSQMGASITQGFGSRARESIPGQGSAPQNVDLERLEPAQEQEAKPEQESEKLPEESQQIGQPEDAQAPTEAPETEAIVENGTEPEGREQASASPAEEEPTAQGPTEVTIEPEDQWIADIFDKYDTNKNGILQRSEAEVFCEDVGNNDLFNLPKKPIDAYRKLKFQSDTNRNGEIEKIEFIQWFKKKRIKASQLQIQDGAEQPGEQPAE